MIVTIVRPTARTKSLQPARHPVSGSASQTDRRAAQRPLFSRVQQLADMVYAGGKDLAGIDRQKF